MEGMAINVTSNITRNWGTSSYLADIRHITHIYIGFMAILGLIGNCLCIVAFSCSPLVRKTATQYLIALSCADSGFLLTLLITWLKGFGVKFYSSSLTCKMTNFVAYASSTASAWVIIAFTVERFVIVYYPFYRKRLFSVRHARKVILCAYVLSMGLNTWVLVLTGYNGSHCGMGPRSKLTINLMLIFGSIDSVMSFAVPTVIIMTLNTCTAWKIAQSSRVRQAMTFNMYTRGLEHTLVGVGVSNHVMRKKFGSINNRNSNLLDQSWVNRSKKGKDNYQHPGISHSSGHSRHNSNSRSSGGRAKKLDKLSAIRKSLALTTYEMGYVKLAASDPLCTVATLKEMSRYGTATKQTMNLVHKYNERRITIMLLTVSLTYVCLNLPDYILRTINMILSVQGRQVFGHSPFTFLFQMLFYTQYCVNFCFYSCQGHLYRNVPCFVSTIDKTRRMSVRLRSGFTATPRGGTTVPQAPRSRRPTDPSASPGNRLSGRSSRNNRSVRDAADACAAKPLIGAGKHVSHPTARRANSTQVGLMALPLPDQSSDSAQRKAASSIVPPLGLSPVDSEPGTPSWFDPNSISSAARKCKQRLARCKSNADYTEASAVSNDFSGIFIYDIGPSVNSICSNQDGAEPALSEHESQRGRSLIDDFSSSMV